MPPQPSAWRRTQPATAGHRTAAKVIPSTAMLPPVTVSLPFKIIFFVLVDGWRLVASSLVESFNHSGGVM